jgi:hypothetical protein
MKKLNVLITVAFLLIWSAPAALATGFGYYGTVGQGTLRFDNGWFASDAHGTSRQDTKLLGAGMVLDTAVARNRVFNYRLNVGYEKLKVDNVQIYETDRLESLVIDQDFGSAVYMSDTARIWFGPELRVLIAHDEFAMGVGPVLGINLHTGKEATVALKLGYLFTSFAPGSADYDKESHAFLNLAILFRTEGDQY